eukprot:12256-Heterococcus_DN1.PRE.2
MNDPSASPALGIVVSKKRRMSGGSTDAPEEIQAVEREAGGEEAPVLSTCMQQQAADTSAKRHGIAASSGSGSRSAVHSGTGTSVSPAGSPRRRDLMAAIPEGVSSGDIRYSRGADTEYSHVTSAAVTNSSTALTVPVPAAAVSSTSLVAVTAPDIYSNSTGSGAYSGTADDSVPPLVHGGADSDVSPNDSTSSLTSSALATAAHACMAAAAAPTNSSSGIGTRVLRTMRIMIPQAEVCVSNDGSSFAVYQ